MKRRMKSLAARVFLENTPLKVVALVMALILLVVAREETTRVVDVEVPVVVRSLPPDMVLVEPPPGSIRVKIRTTVQRLTEILTAKIPFELDLSSGGTTQKVYFSYEELAVHLGAGATIISVSPSAADVRLDLVRSKEVPVVPNLVGKPANYFTVDAESVQVTPAKVMVTGANQALEMVHELSTAPIDLSSLKSSHRDQVALIRPEGVDLRESSVTVTVPVREKSGEKTFGRVPISVRNCPKGYSCQPAPAHFSARVEGPQRLVEAVSADTLTRMVHLDGARLVMGPEDLIRSFQAEEPVVQQPPGLRLEMTGARYFNILVERQ